MQYSRPFYQIPGKIGILRWYIFWQNRLRNKTIPLEQVHLNKSTWTTPHEQVDLNNSTWTIPLEQVHLNNSIWATREFINRSDNLSIAWWTSPSFTCGRVGGMGWRELRSHPPNKKRRARVVRVKSYNSIARSIKSGTRVFVSN